MFLVEVIIDSPLRAVIGHASFKGGSCHSNVGGEGRTLPSRAFEGIYYVGLIMYLPCRGMTIPHDEICCAGRLIKAIELGLEAC